MFLAGSPCSSYDHYRNNPPSPWYDSTTPIVFWSTSLYEILPWSEGLALISFQSLGKLGYCGVLSVLT
jgi:hypothetical protein